MKKLFIVTAALMLFSTVAVWAQNAKNRVMLTAAMDIYKTDHRDEFEKHQIGLEANIFVSGNVALTVGYEHRTRGIDAIALGYRLYVLQPVFLRVKPLIATHDARVVDLNLGVGYNHYFNKNISIEFAGDYYFREKQAALRIGISGLL